MEALYFLAVSVGLSCFAVSGRAVNISSAWFLPEEGFPVFYRYFEDKVTWDEAQAVCGSHHADLLSVQTTEELDTARAYLKEIDVADNIWIGLHRNIPEGPFFWTNGEKLVEGYWLEPVPKSNEKLCAAVDPTADYRWKSYLCRGPQLWSFVCQLMVPEWAKGCLIKSLPSLTVTLLPEAGVIQLLSDCGLDGTRRIACNEKADHEEIMKRLSCDVDAFASTVFGRSTTAGTGRDTNTQVSWSANSNQANRHQTTKAYHPLTRHRRNAGPNAFDSSSQQPTTPPIDKPTSPSQHPSLPSPIYKPFSRSLPNLPSHVFPHSPYLASERNAPSTKKPPVPPYKPLPVLLITRENLNDSASSGTSENPPIMLMVDNKDLDGPFLFPLADDIIINNPSLPSGEVISVDLVEVDNLTANGTTNETNPPEPSLSPLPSKTASEKSPELLSVAEGKRKEEDVPQRPKRGRLFSHTNEPSFYPRFLVRVLG